MRNVAIRSMPRNLSSLQAARAIAALLVLLFHTGIVMPNGSRPEDIKPFWNLFEFGDSGVSFFFVLSGFIIFHAHYQDIGRSSAFWSYAWKRFRRIYPIYWIVLVTVLPVYFLNPSFGFGYETEPLTIISSFLLVHLNVPDHRVISISWTLFHEILFYALFSIVVLRGRLGLFIITAWLGLSVFDIGGDHTSALLGFYFSYIHLTFGLGMGVAWWVRKHRVPSPLSFFLLGVTLFLLTGLDSDYWNILSYTWQRLIFGGGAAIAVLGVVELERLGKLKVPMWLKFVGDASYSIYLVHLLALSLFAKILRRTGILYRLEPEAGFILLAAMALAAGFACYFCIERPMLSLLSKRHVPARPIMT